jgi:hypothetical protein
MGFCLVRSCIAVQKASWMHYARAMPFHRTVIGAGFCGDCSCFVRCGLRAAGPDLVRRPHIAGAARQREGGDACAYLVRKLTA